MTFTNAAIHQVQSCTPESLRTLADLLELALDQGRSVVLMRIGTHSRGVFVGDPSDALDALMDHGSVAASEADEILLLTRLGLNHLTVDDQQYRFIRGVRYIADRQVVVFTPA